MNIKVTQAPGYLCHIRATCTFHLPPDTLFRQVITHPQNEKIFRHMDRLAGRQGSWSGLQRMRKWRLESRSSFCPKRAWLAAADLRMGVACAPITETMLLRRFIRQGCKAWPLWKSGPGNGSWHEGTARCVLCYGAIDIL